MRLSTGIVLLALAPWLAGCRDSGSSSTPSTPAAPTSVLQPVRPWSYGAGYTLLNVTLAGQVFEVTPPGQVPVEGVEIYCDACGEFGHTSAKTDLTGFYRFTGVWLPPGNRISLLVTKEGYLPNGLAPTIDGDTRFDIQVVRR